MKLLLPLLLLLLLISCRDQRYEAPEPWDAWRVEGHWVTLPPASPLWHYEFEYPHLTQWIEDLGATITTQEYIFAPTGDRIEIAGDGGERTWRVQFFGDTVMEYRTLTVKGTWGPTVYLKRE